MKYNIDVEIDEFQDSIVKKYAITQAKSPEELLVTYFNSKVKTELNGLLTDELTNKVQEHGTGWVLSAIKAME